MGRILTCSLLKKPLTAEIAKNAAKDAKKTKLGLSSVLVLLYTYRFWMRVQFGEGGERHARFLRLR